ncbi:MAG: DNA polymerase III subunit gamma/tau, partial [Nocardioides sp.]
GPPDWALREPPEERDAPPSAAARRALLGDPGEAVADREPDDDPDQHVDPDDPDAETSGLTGAELLQRELGAQIIEQTTND